MVALTIALVGLVLPITLLVAAGLIAVLTLTWAAYEVAHDEWKPRVGRFLTAHHLVPHFSHATHARRTR